MTSCEYCDTNYRESAPTNCKNCGAALPKIRCESTARMLEVELGLRSRASIIGEYADCETLDAGGFYFLCKANQCRTPLPNIDWPKNWPALTVVEDPGRGLDRDRFRRPEWAGPPRVMKSTKLEIIK
jgi:hypothetical protein